MEIRYKYSFEKLQVWQLAKSFTVSIYKMTEKFPEIEKFGLTGQLRRASVSICSNIAEGNSRISKKERAYFFQIAFSSTMEVLNQLIIAKDLNFLEKDDLKELRDSIDEISNKLNALHKKQLN